MTANLPATWKMCRERILAIPDDQITSVSLRDAIGTTPMDNGLAEILANIDREPRQALRVFARDTIGKNCFGGLLEDFGRR